MVGVEEGGDGIGAGADDDAIVVGADDDGIAAGALGAFGPGSLTTGGRSITFAESALRCPLEYSQDPECLDEHVVLSDDLVERDHQRLEPVVAHDRELPIPEVALPEEGMSSMFAGARLQHLVEA